jgi:hypothetical protein
MREAVYEERNERTAVPDNYRHFLRLKKTATTLEDVAIFAQRGLSVSPNGDHPRIVGAVLASPNLLQLLGVQARPAASALWAAARPCSELCSGTPDPVDALWNYAARSGDFCGCGCNTAGGGRAGLLSSGVEGVADRPNAGIANGIS